MRDPKRIARLMRKLKEAHQLVPDLRLGQLFVVIQASYPETAKQMYPGGQMDPFNIEDDVWEKAIDHFVSYCTTPTYKKSKK